jgi:hypothetical protein
MTNFMRWPVRGALAGLIIGATTGVGLAIFTASLSPLWLIAFDSASGAIFGLIAGLIAWLLNTLIGVNLKRKIHRVISGGINGAMIGAIILMQIQFGDGWPMAVFLAVEGAIAGGILGLLIGTALQIMGRRQPVKEPIEL